MTPRKAKAQVESAQQTDPSHGQAATPAQAMAGILQRMGDVLGPGAIYSLVHHGALQEGASLASQQRPADAAQAVQAVANLMGLSAQLESLEGNRHKVRFKPTDHILFDSRGIVALLVGLLEGHLTAALHGKVQRVGDRILGATGELEIEFRG